MLQQAVELDTAGDWTLHHHLGLAHEKQGELPEAAAHYRVARDLNPELPSDMLQNVEVKIREQQLAAERAVTGAPPLSLDETGSGEPKQ